MTGIDWLIVFVVLISVIHAAAQGFFFEIFSVGGAIVGFVLAMWEYPRLAPWFITYVKSDSIANAAAFFTLFFGCVLLSGITGRIARWAMHGVGLKGVDRFLGGAFGLVRGVVMVTAAILGITAFMPGSRMLARSELSKYFLLTARSASWVAPEGVRNKLKQGVSALREAKAEAIVSERNSNSRP